MKEVRLACNAMATRFELLLCGDDAARVRAAGEMAIAEILRLHDELTAFRSTSQIGRINADAANIPVRVSKEVFDLLSEIHHLWTITDGAFDVTVGPLLSIWGFRGLRDATPDEQEILDALEIVGMAHVELNAAAQTVRLTRSGMLLDLGAVGKGYALDVATEILASCGIQSGLLHGGTSSIRAIGSDASGAPWRVAVRRPSSKPDTEPVTIVELADEAMSVSNVSGRILVDGDRSFGHVIDPRTGNPIDHTSVAVAVAPRATTADALSTGLLVLGRAGLQTLQRRLKGFRGAVFQSADYEGHQTEPHALGAGRRLVAPEPTFIR